MLDIKIKSMLWSDLKFNMIGGFVTKKAEVLHRVRVILISEAVKGRNPFAVFFIARV